MVVRRVVITMTAIHPFGALADERLQGKHVRDNLLPLSVLPQGATVIPSRLAISAN
jgi:hypothetical protein